MRSDTTPKENLRDYLPYFRMLFDQIRIGIIIADDKGMLIYYNGAQEEIDGLDKREVLGKAMYEVYTFTPENSPAMTVLRSGKPIVDKVHSYMTRSGNHVNSSCTIYPLCSEKGNVIGVVCYSESYTNLGMQLQTLQRNIDGYNTLNAKQSKISSSHYSFDSLIGTNKNLEKAVSLAKVATMNTSSVMIIGETGVGKEILAQSIHYESERSKHSYMAINCSAVPETLLEGILFGTVKGAFTGALNKPGLFEVANKGTVFLDEVDSMPVTLQSKLLRVLQEHKIRRVGETIERNIDVRIISAVARNPATLMNEGLLRQDFYYRLGVIGIFLPPLRERKDDIPALAEHFLYKHSQKMKQKPLGISPKAINLLLSHNWPGNVRELEHCIEASLNFLGNDFILDVKHFCNTCHDLLSNAENLSFEEDTYDYRKQPQTIQKCKERLAMRLPMQDEKTSNLKPAQIQPLGVNSNIPSSFLPSFNSFSDQVSESPTQSNSLKKYLLSNRKNLALVKYEAEISLLKNALQASAGNCSLAAKLLSISPQLLHYKVKKYEINPKSYAPSSL